MKEDKLEQFLADHRQDFDSESPPPMIWMNLEKELANSKIEKTSIFHQLKQTNLIRVMQVAAMFIVVMSVGLLIGMQINKSGNTYDNPRLDEFVEAERHYNKKIDKMWATVKATDAQEAEDVKEDLKSLDAVYNELKEELLKGKGNNTNKVVNSMIYNYRTKLEILETVLNKTNQHNQLNIEDDKVEI
tara:strand:- start:1007 stop:1570 length:564 start_codon:yes stop_codon:yes gene_type:complete